MKYAIKVTTQEEYDQLMDIYEKKGWKWQGGDSPKVQDIWKQYGQNSVIDFFDSFQYCSEQYYKKSCPDIKFLTLKQLLEMEQRQPKRGDWVMVRGDYERHKRIYLTTVEGSDYPYICVENHSNEKFLKSEIFSICTRKEMKPLEEEKTELTLQQIADKFQIPVEQLRIKE